MYYSVEMVKVAQSSGTHSWKQTAERRLVSVLFTDMVGYTAIIERLGEEDTVAFTRMIYRMLTEVVQEHSGVVRGFAGDSIMAVFGIPEALEDAALRACMAGIAIQHAFAERADEIAKRFNVRPAMRVGVSSGTAIVAAVEGDDGELTAVGNTVNFASRIQALAPESGCLICDITRSLVQWQVDVSYDGAHHIKGIADKKKLWRLLAIKDGASRFQASLGRGLSQYIGRTAELADLADAQYQSGKGLQLADLVAEPGLGKTRIVFEFLQSAQARNMTIYTGYCTTVGQRVPFLPFIEVIRASFRIQPTDNAADTQSKLKKGLERAGLHTAENLGLLMNLLGLTPPAGALDKLDGVLIGLRTRDLLPAMLEAQCAQGPVILLVEDIHWIDGASEDLLNSLITLDALKNLLVLTTRRPEYVPRWSDTESVRTIALKPLVENDIRHLVQTRLDVAELPATLIHEVVDRAGGNPLFAEEILIFLAEQGALRVDLGDVVFDAEVAHNALPASMQGLLSARIEQLQPADREVLQAAAAIGRRFDPGLLSVILDAETDVNATLDRMQALDLIRPDPNSTDYMFKHVLLRDTVYHNLLADRRAALHFEIAQALQTRNSNRLPEVAETLAHHYSQTPRSDLSFTFNAMAGAKSLGVFSHDQAKQYFATTLALYERDPDCATDAQFAEFIGNYALCSNISLDVLTMIELAPKVRPILNAAGDSGGHVRFLHHYVSCLVCNSRFHEAARVQKDLTAMAERLGDPQSIAYAMVNELSVAVYSAALSNAEFDEKKDCVDALLKTFYDAYLKNFYLATAGWNELTRGRVVGARDTAEQLIAVGVQENDPRALGYGNAMKALVAVVTDDHQAALDLSQEAERLSRAEFEIAIAVSSRVAALVALRQSEALEMVTQYIKDREADGCTLFAGVPQTMLGVGLAMDGRVTEGLASIKDTIARREAEGASIAVDWNRLTLAEVYLQIVTGEGGASLSVLWNNFRTLVGVMMTGEKQIRTLIDAARKNPQFDDDGHYFARGEMILGLLCKHKKRRAEAAKHLATAQRLIAPTGQSPMLARVERALKELAT